MVPKQVEQIPTGKFHRNTYNDSNFGRFWKAWTSTCAILLRVNILKYVHVTMGDSRYFHFT